MTLHTANEIIAEALDANDINWAHQLCEIKDVTIFNLGPLGWIRVFEDDGQVRIYATAPAPRAADLYRVACDNVPADVLGHLVTGMALNLQVRAESVTS